MKILVVTVDPNEIINIGEQLSEHDVKTMQSNMEFIEACAQNKNFIQLFDAVLLADMFLLESGRVVDINGLLIASHAMEKGVPYVGLFSHTDYIVSAWAKINHVTPTAKGQLVVVKIKKTFFGSMRHDPERNWAGLLSGLVTASAN